MLRAKQAREAGAFGGGEGPHSRVFRPRNGIGRSNSIKPLKSKVLVLNVAYCDRPSSTLLVQICVHV